jgi:hypothetical protein
MHSPELVLQIQEHLERNGEDVDARTAFSGTDASAFLCFSLIEALLSYEQIRLELLQQTGTTIPANHLRAMATGLKLEPALIHVAKEAFDLHLQLWNAHSMAARTASNKREAEAEEEFPERDADPFDRGEDW